MQPSVIAHVFVTAFQRGHGGARVVLGLLGSADVCCACKGVQAAMSEWRIGVLRVKKSGEAGAQLRLTHVTRCHTVSSVTVASDLSFSEQYGHGAELQLQPDEDVAGMAIH